MKLTKKQVLEAALKLIDLNAQDKETIINSPKFVEYSDKGFVTTLEVKLLLQKEGTSEYLAYQKNVSNILDEIYNDGDIDYKFYSNYRIYQLITSKSQKIINQSNSQYSIANQLIDQVFFPEDGDWEITNRVNDDVIYINEQYTKDNARCFGRKYWSIPLGDVRAFRKKN